MKPKRAELIIENLFLAHSSAERRRVVANCPPEVGLPEALFEQVAKELATNPKKAELWSRLWRWVIAHPTRPEQAMRARALGLRAIGKWLDSAKMLELASKTARSKADKLSLKVGQIDSYARAGEVRRAVAIGSRLYPKLLEIGRADLAARCALNLGNALLWRDDYEESRIWYARAIERFASGEDSLLGAALLGISSSHLFGGDAREARRFADQAASLFDRLGETHFRDLCEVNTAQARIVLGEPDAAIPILLSVVDRFADAPGEAARVQEFLGDAYLQLNLTDEAIACYGQALSLTGKSGAPLNKANCALGLGRGYCSLGEYAPASRLFRSAAREYARVGNAVWKSVATVQLASVSMHMGERSNAAKHLQASIPTLERSKAIPHLANALLLRAALQDSKAKDRTLRRVLSLLDDSGLVSLRWQPEWMLATGMTSASDRRRALLKVAQMIIRGSALTSSLASRGAYMKDKFPAIRETLEALLASPTKRNVGAAKTILAATRGAALAATSKAEASRQVANPKVVELRERLAAVQAMSGRGKRISDKEARSLKRAWAEAASEIHLGDSVAQPYRDDCVSFVTTESALFAIAGDQVSSTKVGATEIAALSRRLRMLITSHQTGYPEPEERIERQARSVSEKLGLALDPVMQQPRICLDGPLWDLPWSVLGNVVGLEPILMVSPTRGNTRRQGSKEFKVVIFAYEGDDLPSAALEMEAVVGLFPEAEIVRTPGQLERFLESGKADLLHVIGHGNPNHRNPMFSTISTAGTVVSAAAIATARVRPRFVTLSACSSAFLGGRNHAEPDGMVRAFLSLGAEYVLAALWPVEDRISASFMTKLLGSVKAKTFADAVSSARLYLRGRFCHPYHWGSYQLYGG